MLPFEVRTFSNFLRVVIRLCLASIIGDGSSRGLLLTPANRLYWTEIQGIKRDILVALAEVRISKKRLNHGTSRSISN